MEINKHFGDIVGVVATEDIREGRFVVLTSHSYDNDFGSLTDVPGAALPTTADQAKRARHIIAWAVDNRQPPYFVPMPAYAFSMRSGGFGGSNVANVPFTASVWLTWPSMQKGCTAIPSGYGALAFGAGTYTIESGCYIYSVGLRTPGCLISVSFAVATKGMAQAAALWDSDVVVGKVVEYYSNTGDLTITTRDF